MRCDTSATAAATGSAGGGGGRGGGGGVGGATGEEIDADAVAAGWDLDRAADAAAELAVRDGAAATNAWVAAFAQLSMERLHGFPAFEDEPFALQRLRCNLSALDEPSKTKRPAPEAAPGVGLSVRESSSSRPTGCMRSDS